MRKLLCPVHLRPITQVEFHLKNTLVNGQAFNWSEVKGTSMVTYRGIIKNRIVDFTVNADDEVLYRGYPTRTTGTNDDDLQLILEDYLQLRVDTKQLHENWAKSDAHYARVYQRLKGVRVLRQDPFECMISFICSSNNNIPRITKILQSIRKSYGTQIMLSESDKEILGILDKSSEATQPQQVYYGFPALPALMKATMSELNEIGLGYRSNYIVSTVAQLNQLGGEKYLHDLRKKESAEEITTALKVFMGIGQKVADCIALFSLDAKNLIPVDTHVFQIYERVYKSKGSSSRSGDKDKKMNPMKYKEVTEFFKKKFGDYAGWAQQCIFAFELPAFQETSTTTTTKATTAQSSTNKQDPESPGVSASTTKKPTVAVKAPSQTTTAKTTKSQLASTASTSSAPQSYARKTRSSGRIAAKEAEATTISIVKKPKLSSKNKQKENQNENNKMNEKE